jgi:superfamily II DNA or RNA helicase
MLIVDEAHHVSRFAKPFTRDSGGSYARVLTQFLSPIRLGFTATLPIIEEAKWALEGYLGSVISKKKIQEVGRLAKVKIILRKLPITQMAKDSKRYPEVYQYAVVFNSRRNKAVLMDADKLVKAGRTVLILVTQIQHGANIMEMAKRGFPHLRIKFVFGGISIDERVQVQTIFDQGNIDVVVANVVWREGVDIPSLGAIINASGGKSEIMTLQSLGRGLRTVPGVKEDVVLVDYFDPSHKYLIDHFGQRVTLYFEEGWMGEEING